MWLIFLLNPSRRLRFRILVEFFVVATVLGFVVSIIAAEAGHNMKMFKIMGAYMGPLMSYKTEMSIYYALHGEWPKDQETLPILPEIVGDFPGGRNSLWIANGALNINLPEKLSGKVITFRPATPADDALGPVQWVVGSKKSSHGWTIAGEDHTTLDDRYFPEGLK